jgi:hypothetical protein
MAENKLIRQDKERRLENLEQELIAATRGATVELSVADIRKKRDYSLSCVNGPGANSESQ